MAEIAFLLRHGAYEIGSRDEHLSELGRQQSEQARDELIAKRLGGRAYLLSSDTPRTLETATIIGEGLDVKPLPSPRIRKASNSWHVVDVLGDFLIESLRIDAKIDADPEFSFVVVTHAPMIASLKDHEEASLVENGRIYPFYMDRRDPNYDARTAEFILGDSPES